MKSYSYLFILALCSLLAGCMCTKKCHKEHKPAIVENVVTEAKEFGDVKEIGIEDLEPVTDIDIIDVPQDTVVDVSEDEKVPYGYGYSVEEIDEFAIIDGSNDQENDDEFAILIDEDKE